jgi:hypothetical protein
MLLVGQCTTISLLVYSHTNCLVLFSHQTGRCNAIQKEIKKKKKKGTNLTTSRAPRLSSLLTHQSRSSVRAITAYRPPFFSPAALLFSLSLSPRGLASAFSPPSTALLPPLPFGWLYRSALDWKRGLAASSEPVQNPTFLCAPSPSLPAAAAVYRIKCAEIFAVRGVVVH